MPCEKITSVVKLLFEKWKNRTLKARIIDISEAETGGSRWACGINDG